MNVVAVVCALRAQPIHHRGNLWPVRYRFDHSVALTADPVEERSRSGSIRCIKKGRFICRKQVLFTCWHSSFQQAVTRNLNDRNAQLQKQLENVVREGKLL